MVKQSENNFSTNDLFYRFPAMLMLAVGIFMGYKLMIIDSVKCKNIEPDLSVFGQQMRSDYVFAFVVMTAGFLILFWPFVVKLKRMTIK